MKRYIINKSDYCCKHTGKQVILTTVEYRCRAKVWCSGHTRGEKSLSRQGVYVQDVGKERRLKMKEPFEVEMKPHEVSDCYIKMILDTLDNLVLIPFTAMFGTTVQGKRAVVFLGKFGSSDPKGWREECLKADRRLIES